MTTDTTTRLDVIRALLERRYNPYITHYDGCEAYHIDCAAWRLLEVVGHAQRAMDSGMKWDTLWRLQIVLTELETAVPS